jgi:DNA-binding NtrC family response regulator
MEKHIIVVEDDDGLRYGYCKLLGRNGYTAHPFPDYRGVMEHLDGGLQADLLLVDIVLPPGTPHGVSVAGMARVRRHGLPVLYVTGYADYSKHVVEGSSVLLKPVPDEALLASVERMLSVSG